MTRAVDVDVVFEVDVHRRQSQRGKRTDFLDTRNAAHRGFRWTCDELLYLLYPRDYVDSNLEALILDETYVDHPTPDYALYRQSQAIAGFDSYEELPSLCMPVLVMTGEDDVLVPPGNSETLAGRIQGAELVKIPGAGHGFLKQVTDETVPKILGFLKRVDEGLV